MDVFNATIPAKELIVQSSAPAPLSVSLSSLAAAFGTVPDPRRLASVRYPLSAILAMTVAAILSNHLSVLAISEWAARQTESTLLALGFPTPQTPRQSTVQRLFAKLDGRALGQVLATALASAASPVEDGLQGIAIDGKAQRGRLAFTGGGCPVHALSAYCHAAGLVLAQEPIHAPRSHERGEAELTVAPGLIDRLDWHGRVLTGDALFCQRELCQQVRAAGGDYLLAVKANQGRLFTDIALLFDPPGDALTRPLTDRRTAETLDYGHGRILERRVLTASTDLVGYLDWPGHAQVVRIERTWQAHGRIHRAVGYAITSLAPARADPAQLLALKRGHWSIENRLHRAKDVNLGEDASLIHAGAGPHVMTLLRDAALDLLHAAGVTQIAARLRHHSQYPDQAVALVLGALTTHA
jgi:predicted transposase YbfD/YdcC